VERASVGKPTFAVGSQTERLREARHDEAPKARSRTLKMAGSYELAAGSFKLFHN
jgi:hypothetical protein